MGINLTEISQKVLDTVSNASNVFRKMYDLHYNPNPLDVSMEYIDENGQKRATNVPNRSKVLGEFEEWKNGVRNEFPVINLYEHPADFGRDLNSTDVPAGCYGWSENIERSYSYRNIADEDKDMGFPDKFYIPPILVCKEHWKGLTNDSKLAIPNSFGYPRRKDTGYITVSFMYRIINPTGNFDEKLVNAGFDIDGNWHKKNIIIKAANEPKKAWWPRTLVGIDANSEVDFEWAMLLIVPGKIPDIQEYYIDYIGA